MSEAAQFLVSPAEPDDSVTNGFVNPTDIFNYVSPSAWVNSIIEDISGIDIFGYATDYFTGEWGALYKFGEAMGGLAQFLQQVGVDVQAAALKVDGEWSGNAADASYNYFTKLAVACSGQQIALYAAAKGYRDAARGAWQLSQQLGNLLQAIADKGILIVIAAAAGTATAETVVGPVAGYGFAVWQALELLELVNRASMIINTAGTVIMSVFGGAMDFAGRGGDLSAVPLPATPYGPPGA